MPAERKSSPYRNSWSHFTTGKVQGKMLKVDPNMERSMTSQYSTDLWTYSSFLKMNP